MNPADMLMNLVLMARADGELAAEERALLEQRRAAWGVSDEEFERILTESQSPKAKLRLPETKSQRYDSLADMAVMMAADGVFSEFEKQLLAIAAVRMEIPHEDLDAILEEFSDDDDDIVMG